jgi:hypothetical protein
MEAIYGKVNVVPIAEIVSFSASLSAIEDIVKRCDDVQGVWPPLDYVRELRRVEGSRESLIGVC